jgi:4-nitrophenyl phosphatase
MPNEFDLKQIHGLVIDMDGVLWRGNSAIPGLNGFFDFMHQRALPFVLATNNATKTPEQYLHKLGSFGVKTVSRANILTSSLATAAYLRRDYPPGSKVYVLGQDGLHAAMQEAGFIVLPDAGQPVEVVVAGADFSLTYDKLKYATLLIGRGARFVGTNDDLTFPSEEGLIPGAGSILAAIEAATGVKPATVGKPARLMFDIAIEIMGTRPGQTAMVGDRLETDILGGQRAGLKTILVTTGVDNEQTMAQKGIQPDAVFSGIAELVEVWKAQD